MEMFSNFFNNLASQPFGIAVGAGIVCILWGLLGKDNSGKATAQAFLGESSEELAKLQAELATAKEEIDKVADMHSYTRQLETKLQVLEAATAEPGSEEHEMRVRVLEQQLGEKAAIEAKLAITQQELSDLKAKFEMHQAVATATSGSAPVAEAAPAPTPVVETPISEAAPEPITPAPIVEKVSEPTLDEVFKVEKQSAPTIAAEKVEQPVAAQSVEMEVLHNENPVSPTVQPMVASGGVAVAAKLEAVEERPVLRVEVPTPVTIADNRDPLEDIDGIGPVYQQKLYEAGIKTFAQLAAASPSRITEVIEPQNWQHIDVMKWRRESALYAAGEKS
jgi:predicted flap endonuclease-1-like 5' DNA nuclease